MNDAENDCFTGTVNDLINAHSQINASYIISIPLEVQSLPPSYKRPVSNRRGPQPPPTIASTIKEVNDAKLVDLDDDEDIDIKL